MPTLQPQEYDISFFDGADSPYQHNAGYQGYQRWQRIEGDESSGEFFKDYAKSLFDKYQLNGKKVLEIGCAKGFLVKDLRDLGTDAYGLDISEYAIGKAEAKVREFLSIGDARTALAGYGDAE